MEYNTQRNKLVFREYGRNIQKMIEYTSEIKDNEKRNKYANYVIELMGQMNPPLRNVEEFRHKLWDHLYMMSDFKIGVDSPYPTPTRESVNIKPKPLTYPKHKLKYKHYGKYVEDLIKKALTFEDEEKKKEMTTAIGNYMKLVYMNWNKETVNDLLIKNDIETLSGGALTLDETTSLDILSLANRQKKKQQHHTRKKPDGKRGGFNKRRKQR